MKTDIQVGDTVVCIEKCPPHINEEPWAFPPDEGSVWVVENMCGGVVNARTGEVHPDFVGIHLVGDTLPRPACRLVDFFRKVFPAADEKSARYDVRKPVKVTA